MKRTCSIFLLIGFISIANCQTFKGTVYDKSTDSVLTGAVIYINGTTNGTVSDIHGNFSLNTSNYNSMPITISFVGYCSVTLSEYNCNKQNDIFLSPKNIEINEIVVEAKKGWERDYYINWKRDYYLKIFIKEFLGESENASDCEILNKEYLRFIYNKDSNFFSAFSSEPILIQNKALAYNITYFLDIFICSRRYNFKENEEQTEKVVLIGDYTFKDEIATLNESEKMKVEKRREKAFYGSRMDFFRQLYHGKLSQKSNKNILLSDNSQSPSKYSIISNSDINANSLVVSKDSVSAYLKHSGELFIKYQSYESIIDIDLDSTYFQKNGYFYPYGKTFKGKMSKERIGDLLPFEYMVK